MPETQTLLDPSGEGNSREGAPLLDTQLGRPALLATEERELLEGAIAWSRSVGAGKDLVREGELSDHLLVVAEGWACRYATTRDGGRQVSALIVPGDVANLGAIMLDRLGYGVRTLTPVTVLALARDRVESLAAQRPAIGHLFTWLSLVENAILSRLTLSLGRRSARERLAHLLCELSVRLDGETGNESRFALPLTQEVIADALGLTAVHVNRTLQRLRGEGAITIDMRVLTVPDVRALRKIGDFDPRYLHARGP